VAATARRGGAASTSLGHGATAHGRRRALNDDGREAAHNEGLFVAASNYHYNRCPRPRMT
jgi:hypothetical protein